MRRAWSLAGGVADAPADAAGGVDDVEGVVVASDDGVVAVAVDVAASLADPVAVDVLDVVSPAAMAVPATPSATAAITVARRALKRAFMTDSSIGWKRRRAPERVRRCKDPALVMR
jgi:hypothetical protein